jgi:hypothetical protein
MRCDGEPVRPGMRTTRSTSRVSQPDKQNGTLSADTIRASGLVRPHQKAEHKTAPDQNAKNIESTLATREPSTQDVREKILTHRVRHRQRISSPVYGVSADQKSPEHVNSHCAETQRPLPPASPVPLPRKRGRKTLRLAWEIFKSPRSLRSGVARLLRCRICAGFHRRHFPATG